MKSILLDGEIPVNCFVIEDQGRCYIIDPGFQKERLQEYIKTLDLEVIGILLTHAHFDHIEALDAFDVPIYIHKNEKVILQDGFFNGFSYGDRVMPYELEDLNIVWIDESPLKINDQDIHVLLTPGHTPGSVCYKHGDVLYSGDTLFRGSVGQWDFPCGSQEDLKKSIISLLESLDDKTTVHPAHGSATSIAYEKQRNIYYHHWKNKGLIDNYVDNDKFQEARRLMENKEFSDAIVLYKQLITQGDRSPLIYMYLNYALDQIKDNS